jgi:PPP family 3-phenylpropionic acid transporter
LASAFALLCTHWLFTLGSLGIYFPYFALYLRENIGLSSSAVGIVLALPPLVGVIAQPAWGHVADRTGSRSLVLVLLSIGSALGYIALSHAHRLWPTLLATAFLAVFLTALFPMSTSVTLASLASPSLFGRARVWGTIGYLIVVTSTPLVLPHMRAALDIPRTAGGPSEPGLEWMFYVAAALTLIGALAAALLPKTKELSMRAQKGDLRALFAEPAYVRLLLFNVGIHFFMHGPTSLLPLYVRSRGGSMTDLSHMWICMAGLEIPLMFASGALFARFGVTRLMLLASFAGGARWIVCALAPSLAYVYPAQTAHALVVTGLNVGSVLYVEQIVPARLRSTAQSTLVMVGSSVGGMLSTSLGGIVVDHAGVNTLYLGAGIGAFAWAFCAQRLLHARPASDPPARSALP